MTATLNDGSQRPPALRVYLNLGTLGGLPEWSSWPRLEGRTALERLRADGFEGVQGGDPKLCAQLGMGCAAGGRVDSPEQADGAARWAKGEGHECLTVHVGWGIEDDGEVDRLVGGVLAASAKHDLPIYIETHRATVTQDMWRTVQIARRFPDVRFNGDFSHYYTGLEMPYGGIEKKNAFMAPIYERVRFLHGRIGSSGSMQVDIGDGVAVPQAYGRADFVQHFREMWTLAMAGFLRGAAPGDYLVFAPELLDGGAYYARKFAAPGGEMREEGDRYAQALVYARIARACFAAAQDRVTATSAS